MAHGGGVLSSTGRGPRLGGPEDFYRTPSWTVRRLLEAWHPPGGLWLEPGAGSGSIIRAVNGVRSDVRWLSVEVRSEAIARLSKLCVETFAGDFLGEKPIAPREDIAVVLANGPFNEAQRFIERSRVVAPNATIAFLLRLNFVGSEERASFMRQFPPDIKTLPNRPSFTLRLTDSIEYAWFIWPPYARSQGTFEVLASTSAEERQRDMPEVAKCEPCAGLGGLDAEGRPMKKPGGLMMKKGNPERACPVCFGHGKVVVSWPEDAAELAAA